MKVHDNDILINIRDIQHYLYCSHRWGLITIECSWAENAFVTRANFLHRRVHDPDRSYISRHGEVLTSVQVYNDNPEYNIFGVTDSIELTRSENGIGISGKKGKFALRLVEYKPTTPKGCSYNFEDLMQVFAQKICVDYVFKTDCDAAIYYADIKRKVDLPIKSKFYEYDNLLKKVLAEMRYFIREGKLPPIRKNQKCSGCSMRDICMPKISRKSWLGNEIRRIGDIGL